MSGSHPGKPSQDDAKSGKEDDDTPGGIDHKQKQKDEVEGKEGSKVCDEGIVQKEKQLQSQDAEDGDEEADQLSEKDDGSWVPATLEEKKGDDTFGNIDSKYEQKARAEAETAEVEKRLLSEFFRCCCCSRRFHIQWLAKQCAQCGTPHCPWCEDNFNYWDDCERCQHLGSDDEVDAKESKDGDKEADQLIEEEDGSSVPKILGGEEGHDTLGSIDPKHEQKESRK